MLLRDEVKYKKQNVAGPGSQGVLLVKGKEANVKRLYTPLQKPMPDAERLVPYRSIWKGRAADRFAVRP